MSGDRCTWCTRPGVAQVHVGTRHYRTRSGAAAIERRYAWLCDQCTRETRHEKERSVTT